ncbi:hypothetical protein [Streptomyces sp. NPDC094149]|uniref:hypothetical protein n=1 Tax=Streptomyces sp. NPDC094149 TaxID=3155079 RepID=UPI00331DC7F6
MPEAVEDLAVCQTVQSYVPPPTGVRAGAGVVAVPPPVVPPVVPPPPLLPLPEVAPAPQREEFAVAEAEARPVGGASPFLPPDAVGSGVFSGRR